MPTDDLVPNSKDIWTNFSFAWALSTPQVLGMSYYTTASKVKKRWRAARKGRLSSSNETTVTVVVRVWHTSAATTDRPRAPEGYTMESFASSCAWLSQLRGRVRGVADDDDVSVDDGANDDAYAAALLAEPALHAQEFGTLTNPVGVESPEPGAFGAAWTASTWPVALAHGVSELYHWDMLDMVKVGSSDDMAYKDCLP